MGFILGRIGHAGAEVRRESFYLYTHRNGDEAMTGHPEFHYEDAAALLRQLKAVMEREEYRDYMLHHEGEGPRNHRCMPCVGD